jgi:hypothetical protein
LTLTAERSGVDDPKGRNLENPAIFVPEVNLSPNFSIAKCLIRDGHRVVTGSRESAVAPIRGVPHIHYPCSDHILDDNTRYREMARAVVAALSAEGPVLAICGSDRALGMLEHAEGLLPGLRLCYPALATRRRLTSKTAARSAFEAHGLPVPQGCTFAPGDVPVDFNQDFPVVFKYDTSEGSAGVQIVVDAAELELLASKAALLETPFIVEEFIGPTREVSYTFFVKGNSVYPVFGLEKEFHFRTSYSTTIRFMSQHEEEASFARFHEGFSRVLTDGFYCAQFKDSKVGLLLIEINGRTGNNFRIIARIVPGLAALIVDFYRGSPEWEHRWRMLREMIRPVYGCSLVEDIYARLSHLSGLIRRGLLSEGWREVGDFVHLCTRRPYLDDYAASLLSSPASVLRYYRSFFIAARSERQSTASLKKMVPR